MKKETITSDPRGFFNVEKRDPMQMFGGAKQPKIVTEAQDKESRNTRNAENDLQTKICKWLRNTYPGILFISDFAAGMKLSLFLASIRSLQSCDSKMVDLIILKPSYINTEHSNEQYHALCLELKTGPDKIFMQDGITLLKNEHILAQYETIKALRKQQYAACFACGEAQIKALVSDYMRSKFVHPRIVDRAF